MAIALIVKSKRSGVAGTRFWVVNEPDGWVEATSREVKGRDVPSDVKLFTSEAEAEAFASRWKGHPWWCQPTGKFEVVTIEPVMKQAGWRRVQP